MWLNGNSTAVASTHLLQSLRSVELPEKEWSMIHLLTKKKHPLDIYSYIIFIGVVPGHSNQNYPNTSYALPTSFFSLAFITVLLIQFSYC